MPLRRLPLRTLAQPRLALHHRHARTTSVSSAAVPSRAFSLVSSARFPRKNSQDKDSMDTTPTEYSKSGSDSEAAEDPSAFDPSNTSPEASESSSEATKGKNSPLNVSPANQEVSKPRPAQEGGAERSANEAEEKRKVSGQGNSVKGRGSK